jgi:hypothetical protein
MVAEYAVIIPIMFHHAILPTGSDAHARSQRNARPKIARWLALAMRGELIWVKDSAFMKLLRALTGERGPQG